MIHNHSEKVYTYDYIDRIEILFGLSGTVIVFILCPKPNIDESLLFIIVSFMVHFLMMFAFVFLLMRTTRCFSSYHFLSDSIEIRFRKDVQTIFYEDIKEITYRAGIIRVIDRNNMCLEFSKSFSKKLEVLKLLRTIRPDCAAGNQ